MKPNVIQNLAMASFAAASLASPLIVNAAPTVSGNQISWPSDGWYEVQDAETYESICGGGTSCSVESGPYIVINHTTGERWEPVLVGDVAIQPVAGVVEVVDDASLRNVVDILAADSSRFRTLSNALELTGLDATLSGEGSFTLFAPTEKAFAALSDVAFDALVSNIGSGQLSDILLYHVIEGQKIDSSAAYALSGKQLQAANGDSVVLGSDGKFTVNGVTVFITNIRASNGIIHVIDSILLPPAEGSAVVSTPVTGATPVQTPSAPTQVAGQGNIVDALAADSNRFRTLLNALELTGLDATLSGAGSYTLFAPTEKAFAALSDETFSALVSNIGSGQLSDILLYHVIQGQKIDSSAAYALSGQQLQTANGDSIVLGSDGTFTVNGVTIFITNIETSNGIIHVIDSVLLPPAEGSAVVSTPVTGATPVQTPSAPAQDAGQGNIVDILAADSSSFRTLSNALELTGLDATLAGAGSFTLFAPTEKAFGALGDDTFSALVSNVGNGQLRDILLNHVISGRAIDTSAAYGLSGKPLVTASGDTVVLGSDGKFTVNGVTAFITNIQASNGIVHVIDTVLVP